MHVFTKKMLKTQYHLASFNKPLSQSNSLPEHIVELPAEMQNASSYAHSNLGRQFGDLKNFVRTIEQPTKQARYNSITNEQKPILVYEEINESKNP